MTTKRPFGSLPPHLTMLGMLPQTAAANEEAFFQKPVGTGPFKFGGWTHGEQIVLNANADYWKPGIPKVEKVTFRFIPELSTRVAAHPGRRAPRHRPRVAGQRADAPLDSRRPGPRHARPSRRSAGSSSSPRIRSRIPRVRKAISLAIDRNVIIKDLLLGYARPVDSPIPPGLIGHTSLPARRPTTPRRPARS